MGKTPVVNHWPPNTGVQALTHMYVYAEHIHKLIPHLCLHPPTQGNYPRRPDKIWVRYSPVSTPTAVR